MFITLELTARFFCSISTKQQTSCMYKQRKSHALCLTNAQSRCMMPQASNMQKRWDISTGTKGPCSEELFKAAYSLVRALNGGVWLSATFLCMLHDLPIFHFFSLLTTWGQCLGFHRLVEKKFELYSGSIHMYSLLAGIVLQVFQDKLH